MMRRDTRGRRRRKGALRGSRALFRRDRWPRPELAVALGYLVIASLFGGGLVQWGLATGMLMLATTVLAAFLAWRTGFTAFSGVPLAARIALVGIPVLPLLQMLPLPPHVWRALPGQTLRRATLDAAGIGDSWQPLTLEPAGTALIAVLSIGFVSFVGLLLRLEEEDFHKLLRLLFGLILLGMGVGLLQVVLNGQPQFFNPQGGVLLGFFANKNHMGLAIACAILLFNLIMRQGPPSPGRRLAIGGFTVIALVCIVTTNSRAGLGLGLIAATIVSMDLARGIALRWRLAALLVVLLLVGAVMSSSAFETVSSRVDDVSDDLRWRFTLWSWPLAREYALLGSGLGSFRTLFQAHEQLAWVKPTFVNAVHDDYLQLLIEAGLPGVAILLVLALSVVGGVLAWWPMSRRDPRRRDIGFGLAVIALFAAHSAFDYPLRRPAAWIVFAIALASVYRGTPRDRASKAA